ncbi:MAG: DUF1326 domain-containing protein [Rhodospirillales bacterium]|nr:DUF1326 domain-containing protein [Rhodospirillales bacterium]
MSWSLNGIYFESCNCDTACPCLFLSAPTQGECKALVGWHIEKGEDGDVSLSGLNIALAVHSPGPMAETPWKVAVYVDERADEDQRAALLNIFGGKAGGHPARLATHIGEIVGVKFTPIDFSANGDKHSLKIPEIADVEIVQIQGQNDGPIKITGHPLCVAPGFPATVAKTTKHTYADHGMAWELSDKTGVFSPFAYQSE